MNLRRICLLFGIENRKQNKTKKQNDKISFGLTFRMKFRATVCLSWVSEWWNDILNWLRVQCKDVNQVNYYENQLTPTVIPHQLRSSSDSHHKSVGRLSPHSTSNVKQRLIRIIWFYGIATYTLLCPPEEYSTPVWVCVGVHCDVSSFFFSTQTQHTHTRTYNSNIEINQYIYTHMQLWLLRK